MISATAKEIGRLRSFLRWTVCWVVVATTLTAGCGFPVPMERPQQRRPRGEGPGGRQPLALDPKQELEIGRRAYREVMEQYQGKILPEDNPEVERVQGVLAKLVKAAAIEPLQREINLHIRGYTFAWEANVIRDRQVNAFCLPAGKIFVFTGILRVIGNNDDYLATVLSHEMAHALAHHASERLAREHAAGSIFSKLSYNRMQESEADHIGVFLMTFAGYNPDKAPEFWKRMREAHDEGGELPQILSDHPSDATRVRQLRAWAPRRGRRKKRLMKGGLPRRAEARAVLDEFPTLSLKGDLP